MVCFFYITKCAGWIGTIPMLFGSVGWQRARIGLCSQLKVKKWNHFDQWNIVPLYHLDCCVCLGILSFMFGFSYELLLLRERYDSWILSSNIFKAIGIFFTIGISRYIFEIWRLIVLFLGAFYEPNPTGLKSFAFIHTSDWLWSGSFANFGEIKLKNNLGMTLFYTILLFPLFFLFIALFLF